MALEVRRLPDSRTFVQTLGGHPLRDLLLISTWQGEGERSLGPHRLRHFPRRAGEGNACEGDGVSAWLVLRRLLRATRLDLVAAFVSNGPGRWVICPFSSDAGRRHIVALFPGFGWVGIVGVRTRRRGDDFLNSVSILARMLRESNVNWDFGISGGILGIRCWLLGLLRGFDPAGGFEKVVGSRPLRPSATP